MFIQKEVTSYKISILVKKNFVSKPILLLPDSTVLRANFTIYCMVCYFLQIHYQSLSGFWWQDFCFHLQGFYSLQSPWIECHINHNSHPQCFWPSWQHQHLFQRPCLLECPQFGLSQCSLLKLLRKLINERINVDSQNKLVFNNLSKYANSNSPILCFYLLKGDKKTFFICPKIFSTNKKCFLVPLQ